MSSIDFDPAEENNRKNRNTSQTSCKTNQSENLARCSIWQELMDKYNKEREELEEYLTTKNGNDQLALTLHPVISYLSPTLFPALQQGLIEMLEKVRDEKSLLRPKSPLNGVDFLSEYLYNVNPKYPDRRMNWTYIFDMEWVEKHLETSPRPYYPFSLIWTIEYATLKIQSFMRGYFVRRREDVQEMRVFWKQYKQSTESESPQNQDNFY